MEVNQSLAEGGDHGRGVPREVHSHILYIQCNNTNLEDSEEHFFPTEPNSKQKSNQL